MTRCSGWLWLARHEPLLQQRRDENGELVRPHSVDWICVKCHRIVGETKLEPRWGLMARLRRQAVQNAKERVA